MADFKVPEIDFSWLGQLPAEYELGKKSAQQRGLSEDLANFSLTAPDGTQDLPGLAKILAKHGYVSEAADVISRQTIDPYKAAELGISRERLKVEQQRAAESAKTPAIKEYDWAYGQQGQPTTPPAPGTTPAAQGQQPQLTPAEYLQRRAARGQGAMLPQPQGELKIGTYYDSMDRLAEAAQKLRDDPDLYTATGVAGQLPTVMGGSPKARLQAKMKALKAQVGFNALQAMRDASKTGGAVGQVSNFEQELFQQQLGSLDPAALGEEGYKEALDGVIAYTKAAKDRMGLAFEQTYGQPFTPRAKSDTGKSDAGPGMTTTQDIEPRFSGATPAETKSRGVGNAPPPGAIPTPNDMGELRKFANNPAFRKDFERHYGPGSVDYWLGAGEWKQQ